MNHDFPRMFSVPERRPDQSFYVPLKSPLNAGVRFEQGPGGLVASLTQQDTLATLQKRILTELCKTQSLFKHPPTLASLELITPRWGCIDTETGPQVSPYSHIECATVEIPCFVDLVLVGIQISRSTIQPFFKTAFLEKVPDSLIDLEFGSGSSEEVDEVEEVSDVGTPADALPIVLQDPATTQRKKREAKEMIRAAFRTAERATRDAQQMASDFYEAYDLSDNESAFSEWMSEASSESEEGEKD